MIKRLLSHTGKYNKTILVTHNDLDGMGCAILAAKYYDDIDIFITSNNKTNTCIKNILSSPILQVGTKLIITDLTVGPKTLSKVIASTKINEIEIIDHHCTQEERLREYDWAICDTRKCATYLMYEKYNALPRYGDLVHLIDDWDRWGNGTRPSYKASKINDLFLFLGYDSFYNRFSNESSTKLTEEENKLLELENNNKELYLEKMLTRIEFIKTEEGHEVGLVHGSEYMSEIADRMLFLYPGMDYAIVINYCLQQVRLRSETIDVSKIAKRYGGGGHPCAAGFPIHINPIESYNRIFNDERK